MAGTATYPSTINLGSASIADADGVTLKTLFTAPAAGSRVNGISLTSSDSVSRDVELYINLGGSDIPLGCVTVPANAGTVAGVSPVSMLAILQGVLDGAGYMLLKGGAILKVAALAAGTHSKQVNAIAFGADFT